MHLSLSTQLKKDITNTVKWALKEDLGLSVEAELDTQQDITAMLIPSSHVVTALVITRENCTICGIEWVDEVFKQLDSASSNQADFKPTVITWFVKNGQQVEANTHLFEVSGSARTILTGERVALNFMQTLSGTATLTRKYVAELAGSQTQLLDTRKTLPGLRSAQKYAVLCGGGINHRVGLFDAFLIKENHIAACGGISQAIATAKKNHKDKTVEVEVESLDELNQALMSGADILCLIILRQK